MNFCPDNVSFAQFCSRIFDNGYTQENVKRFNGVTYKDSVDPRVCICVHGSAVLKGMGSILDKPVTAPYNQRDCAGADERG
jgi:hypothetical protein